jgi:1-phosphatidylinositol phosphodiesterase
MSILGILKRKPKMSSSDPVTIRNISDVPLTLTLVEHFDSPKSSALQLQDVTRGINLIINGLGFTNNITRADVPQISPEDKPFATRECSIAIPPFQNVQTDVKATINNPKERLRLTFTTQAGGKHQMYCPVPTSESETLVAISPNPKIRLTGVYLTQSNFAALYSSTNLDSWMRELPDSTPLGALSIPGTHNSPTCHNAAPSVRCQAVSPVQQLKNGVRFFDLRVQVPTPYNPNSDALALVHSVFPISLTGTKYFRDLYNDITQFLKENPSETLIVSIKREGPGDGTDQQLSQILKKHYTNLQTWFTQPRVPTLGEVRGRIVLLRRFVLDDSLKGEWGGKGWGIDAQDWADNTPCAMCPSGDVCIQDFYEVLKTPTIEQKIKYAEAQLEKSGGCTYERGEILVAGQDSGKKYPLYINFLSGSNFWNVETWPEKIAAKVNPSMVDHLCRKHMIGPDGKVKEGDWSTGIVVMDWVGLNGDWDLVRCVVGMNAKLIN